MRHFLLLAKNAGSVSRARIDKSSGLQGDLDIPRPSGNDLAWNKSALCTR